MTQKTPRKRQETWRKFDQMRRSTCGNCPTGCGVKAFVKDRALVDLFGDEEHPTNKGSYCPKGLLSWILLNHPERITQARIREHSGEPFRDVPYEEALQFISTRVSELNQLHGSDSIVVHADATSPFGYTHGARRFASAIGTASGPDRFGPRALGNSGHIAQIFGVNGEHLLMNSQRDWANSRCILLVGSDPAATDPVTLGPLVDVRDRGGSLIVIDSKTTLTAMKASYFVRVHPGTESVLLAAVCRLLIEDKQVDESFIAESVSGFDTFRAGIEDVTAERAASTCGITEEDVRVLARVIGAASPTQVMCGDWSTRARLDDDLLGLCAAIVCLRGSVGVPGGGLNIMNASPFSETKEPSSTIEHHLLNGATTAALFFHGNPVAGFMGGEALQRQLAKVPLIVQLGGANDETNAFAHVQLPSTIWLEESGLLASNNGRAIQWSNAVVEAVGDCRPALDIWADISSACEQDSTQFDAQRGEALARSVAQSSLHDHQMTTAMTVDALDPETNPPGGLLWPCLDDDDLAFEDDRFIRGDVRGRNILFRRNREFGTSGKRFPNPADKIALANATPSVAITQWSEDKPDNSEHQLKMITTVAVDYISAWSGCSPTPNRPPIGILTRIHPRTANKLGISSGADVSVRNELGEFRGVAELSTTVHPDVIWCIQTPGYTGSSLSPPALFAVPAEDEPMASCTRVTVARL